MKKIVGLLLLLVYLLSIPGLAYSLHFCGEKLTSYTFKAIEKKTCACTKAKIEQAPSSAKSDCCEDQQVDKSTESNQASIFNFKLADPAYSLLPVFFLQFLSGILNFYELAFALDTSLTSSTKVPIYLMNRYFRI